MNNGTFNLNTRALGLTKHVCKLIGELNFVNFFCERMPLSWHASPNPHKASTSSTNKHVNHLVEEQIHTHVKIVIEGLGQNPGLNAARRQNSESQIAKVTSSHRISIASESHHVFFCHALRGH